mgnify:CR=1 FL=1
MTIRAKFFVTEVAKTTYGGRVKLSAVTRGQDNKIWASATPSGSIEMSIRNELAIEQFDVGKEYFVDFSPAPTGKEGME